MNAFEKLEKIDNRYVIDSQKHEIIINPKHSERKKYNLRVRIDGEIYYFKGNGYYSFDKSELICAELGKQAGLKTINPVPAYFIDADGNQVEGILSHDYIENRQNTEIMSGYNLLHNYKQLSEGNKFDINKFFKKVFLTSDDFNNLRVFNNIESYKKALIVLKMAIKNFNPNFNLEIDKNIITDLGKYLIFYFLTNNEDCYAHNIEFILTKKDDRTIMLSLAPLTDNSISLLLKSFKLDYRNFQQGITESQIRNIAKTVLDQVKMPFSVFEKKIFLFRRESIAVEIGRLIEHSPVLKEFYMKLKAIDLKAGINEYKQKNGYEFIDDKDITVASITYEQAIKQLDTGIERCKFFNRINKKMTTKKFFEKE